VNHIWGNCEDSRDKVTTTQVGACTRIP